MLFWHFQNKFDARLRSFPSLIAKLLYYSDSIKCRNFEEVCAPNIPSYAPFSVINCEPNPTLNDKRVYSSPAKIVQYLNIQPSIPTLAALRLAKHGTRLKIDGPINVWWLPPFSLWKTLCHYQATKAQRRKKNE